jgi:hypothetical protein
MASHWQFGHLQPKLWAKEGPGVKLAVDNGPLPDVQFERATWRWKDLDEGYIFGSDLVVQSGVMAVQSSGSPAETISGLHFGSPGNLCHSDVASATSRREYYMGEGDDFPRVRAVVSLVCPSARGKSQHQRMSRMLN